MSDTFRHSVDLRLASYNIRKAKGTDRRFDPARIVDIVASLDADIVALQEADFRWRGRPGVLCRDMIAERTDFQLVDVEPGSDSLGWHGNAVLVRRGLRVTGHVKMNLPGLEPRGALRVDLDVGGPLRLVAAHLGLTRSARRKQLAAIRAALGTAGAPTAILGDFNEWSMSRGLDTLGPDFVVHAPGRSFHSGLPLAALDRLALSRCMDLRAAGVVKTAQSLRASDHLPIWGDATVPIRRAA